MSHEGMVLAATSWPTNADLISDCFRLGYLNDSWDILDPTYGRGTWWRNHRPPKLVANTYPADKELGYDFRATPWPAQVFDAVTFDPPYVSIGGRKTSTIGDFTDRFGLDDAPSSPAGVQELINEGMGEMNRILKPRGIMLVKCKSYVSSGKLWPGTHLTWEYATRCGFSLVDEFTHVGTPGPQSQTRQVHARQNSSTLFVFRKS